MSAPAETLQTTLIDSEGRELRIVRRESDGIFFCDPVELVVYDAEGKVVAVTPWCYRDMIIRRLSPGSIRVFGIATLFGFRHQTWTFSGTQFVEGSPLQGHLAALLASCRHRWLGYAIAIICSLSGALAYLMQLRMGGTSQWSPGCWPWFGIASLLCVYLYSPLSLVVVTSFTLLGSLPLAENWEEASLLARVYGGPVLLMLFLYVFRLVIERFPPPHENLHPINREAGNINDTTGNSSPVS